MNISRDRAYITVDLDHILYNVDAVSKKLKANAGVMPVIKADGYGHGAVPIAKTLERRNDISGFAVATLEEALVLRRVGIKKMLLVLGYIFEEHYGQALENDVSFTVFSYESAEKLSAAALKSGKKAQVHIKVDTGMNRIGIPACVESIGLVQEIAELDGLVMEGIFTHFPNADSADKTDTYEKYKDFHDFIKLLHIGGIDFKIRHYANSACIIDMSCEDCEMVRLGISLYGIYPSDEVKKDEICLRPALSLYASVIHVKEIEAGASIGYGSTFTADKKMKVATISIGYGDGYPRSLSNKGYVLIKGKKAKILGRVCMDLMMVDVTGIDDIDTGYMATLIGENEGQSITIDELSALSGRFPYEFVCDLGKRIPRIYLKNNAIIDKSNPCSF